MTHSLMKVLGETLASGLKNKSITKCSKWAETYRVMGKPIVGPWSFEYHPWLRGMHDCEHESVVGMKGAQLGFTEWALNTAFYHIDWLGNSVAYILPAASPDATDFSSARFDPALELSNHLANLFSDVKNVGHKRAGSANLYIRGSKSQSGLRSIPASLLIFDEVDVMVQENITLAEERASGQIEKKFLYLSTPTVHGRGIHKRFVDSTQAHFMFKCPGCGKRTELIFPDCMVITAEHHSDPGIIDTHLVCKECGVTLPHETKSEWIADGEWVDEYPDRLVKGYHVNQLYSSTMEPHKLAILFLKGQLNAADEQEFYNSKMGLPHEVDGARISDKDIDECTSAFTGGEGYDGANLVTMGIDVGTWLHYEINEWFDNGKDPNDVHMGSTCRVLAEGKVKHFEELDGLINQYRVASAVIDANPERREAHKLANRNPGRVKLCFYGNNSNGKTIHVGTDDQENTITVDRTSWLDTSLGRFQNRTILLPRNVSIEYREHIKEPVRIYVKDKNGNSVARYNNEKADHFSHARNYSEIALGLITSYSQSQDTGVVV